MKIGITFDMSVAVWANGMQQNIVFLYEILSLIGNDCFYVTNKKPTIDIHKNHKGMILSDLMSDDHESLDTLIIAGFDLLPEMYKELKARNSKLKIVLIHYGNKLMDDINYGICSSSSNRCPIDNSGYISEIWTSPHYEFSVNYLKSYYHTEKVFVCPYIWNGFFIDDKLKSMNRKTLFNPVSIKKVSIFEPNKTFSKNCVIPVAICNRYEQIFEDQLESVNVFGCESVRKNGFFKKLMHKFKIVDQSSKCYFNNRWNTSQALFKFGSTVISHQIYNELNYSHLEALHLGIPLIHNSAALQDFGYYYPDFDVDMGAKQLKNAIMNHSSTILDYEKDAKKLTERFDLKNKKNQQAYIDLLKK